MAEHNCKFLRVTKDNKARDRGLIAIDAICAIFEDAENKHVSIMTMDGFWYEVLDSLDKIYEAIDAAEEVQKIAKHKAMQMRQKRIMAPFAIPRQKRRNTDFERIPASPSGEGGGRHGCTFVENGDTV